MKGKDNLSKNNFSVLNLAVIALFIALTYVFTAFINIRLPFGGNGGLIHLGNVPLFLSAILFGKKTSAISGGLGMALFDILSGWTTWAPFTLVIVALMGYFTGLISEKESKNKYFRYAFAMILAIIIKIVGYYIAEWILYGNAVVPLGSIPGNIIQVAAAAVIVLAVSVPLQKAAANLNVTKF